MAVTIARAPSTSRRSDDIWGSKRVHFFQVTLDNSYATGGKAADFRPYGVQDDANIRVFFGQRAPVNAGYDFVYDRTNRKIVVFGGAAAGSAQAEIANATDLSAVVVDILVIED